jgi:hypothetical protein
MQGIEASLKFTGLKDFETFSPEIDLYNRNGYPVDSKGKYIHNPLDKKPDIHYISKDNILIKVVEKKIL